MQKLYVYISSNGSIGEPHYREEIENWGLISKNFDGGYVLREFHDNQLSYDPSKESVSFSHYELTEKECYKIYKKDEIGYEGKLNYVLNKRRESYPSLGEFADAFVKMQNGDSSQMNSYVAACLEVKANNPKPVAPVIEPAPQPIVEPVVEPTPEPVVEPTPEP